MMTTRFVLGLSSGLLAILAEAVYIRSILRGETKPDRGAYIVWAVTSSIAFFAYWAGGAGHAVWFAAGDFVVGLIMLALTFRYGYGWTSRRHIPALIMAAAGLVLWRLTDEPFLALLCSVAVDAVGYVLIAIKSYEAPSTENLLSWFIYLAAALLALAAIDRWDVLAVFYPAYALVATITVILCVGIGRRTHKSKQQPSNRITGPIP